MKKYENTRTGAVIQTVSKVSGDDWKEVRKRTTKSKAKASTKKDET